MPLATLLAAAAAAQTAPPAVTAPPTAPGPIRPPPAAAAPLAIPAAPAHEPPPGAEAVRFTVTAITVEGATVYPPAEFEALTRPLVGREIAASEIFTLAQRIERKYRDDGYFLTLVFVPQQSVSNGQVRLRVLEGYIESVRVEGDVGPVQEQIERYVAKIPGRRPANIADVERYLLLADDLPGISVRAVMRQGTAPGSSELVVQAARREFDGLLTADNRGSRFLGPLQVYLVGGANSFTRYGERTEALIVSTVDREQNFAQLSLSGHYGGEGLKMRAYAGFGRTRPGAQLSPIGYRGEVKVAGVSASYPVIRSRRANLSASGAFDVYSSIVDVSSSTGGTTRQSESELRVVRLGLDANMRDAWSGITFGNARVHRGLDWLNATGPGDQPAARPGAAAEFTKATGEIARLQALYATEDWTFNLLVSAGGQWTNDVLPPSEKFFFGGERNGRGFFSGQLTGDRAWSTTVELQANTFLAFSRDVSGKPWGFPAQFYTYFDAGNAYNIGPGDIRSTRLRSIGVGGRFDMNEWLGLELEGAQRLTRQVEGANTAPISTYEFYWRVTARF